MILEFVSFAHRPGESRDEILASARTTVPTWQANPELIRKHFLLGDDNMGGAVYLWPSREAAQRAHGPEWRANIQSRTGSDPTITYFDVMMVVDNEAGTVTEWPPGDGSPTSRDP